MPSLENWEWWVKDLDLANSPHSCTQSLSVYIHIHRLHQDVVDDKTVIYHYTCHKFVITQH